MMHRLLLEEEAITDTDIDNILNENIRLNENDDEDVDDDKNDVLFSDLYRSMIFLLCLYIVGDFICSKIIKIIPPLVGQIAVGILLGPHGFDFLGTNSNNCYPNLGEIGLVLMLCQAGLEMDFDILKAVGLRGSVMALIGSLLPSTIGFLLAYLVLELNPTSALAVGCSFGPTSAGIALNVLQPCNVLKSPLGQLIVAIAIVDDIIALVVLSQLKALTGDSDTTTNASAVVIPIISALLWLFVGGAIALYVMPRILEKLSNYEASLVSKWNENKSQTTAGEETKDIIYDSKSISTSSSFHLAHVVVLLFVLLPATYYTEASHLLGAFLAGLCVCQQHSLAATKYNDEFGIIIRWLMRIFFGASIAFRIPIGMFLKDSKVIATGFLLSLSLFGKILIGPLLTPIQINVSTMKREEEDDNDESHRENNLNPNGNDSNNNSSSRRRRYDMQHVRDCLILGFSMAGEAEFAMLVAAFGLSEGLVDESVYASTVFAILLSTILSPCLLRLTLVAFPFTTTTTTTNDEGNNDDTKQDDEQENTRHGTSDIIGDL